MRIYESAIQSKLLSYLNPLLSSAQHGFWPKHLISTNLMNLSIHFLKGRQLDTFYGDFENAFDKLWPRILVVTIEVLCNWKKTAKYLNSWMEERFSTKLAALYPGFIDHHQESQLVSTILRIVLFIRLCSCLKAWQSMGYIKMISKGQPSIRTLKVLYILYVRSKLEFCLRYMGPIWSDTYMVMTLNQCRNNLLGDTNKIPQYRILPHDWIL